jgi:carbonic anhydrase
VLLKARMIPSEMLPDKRSYYRYSGSLTTPPCNQVVSWIVMKTPLTVSKAQIKIFEHATHLHNNRPIQALKRALGFGIITFAKIKQQ